MKNSQRYYDYKPYYSRIEKTKWIPGVNNFDSVGKYNSRKAKKYANEMRKKGIWNDSDFMYYNMGYDPHFFKTNILSPQPAEIVTQSPEDIAFASAQQAGGHSFFHHLVVQHDYFQDVETSVNLLDINCQFQIYIKDTNCSFIDIDVYLIKAPNLYKNLHRFQTQPAQRFLTTGELFANVNDQLEDLVKVGGINLPDPIVAQQINLDLELPYNNALFNTVSKYEICRKHINVMSSDKTASHKVSLKFKANKTTGSVELGFNDAIFVVGFCYVSTIHQSVRTGFSSQTSLLFTKN